MLKTAQSYLHSSRHNFLPECDGRTENVLYSGLHCEQCERAGKISGTFLFVQGVYTADNCREKLERLEKPEVVTGVNRWKTNGRIARQLQCIMPPVHCLLMVDA